MHNLCILFAYSMHNQDTKPKKLVFIRPSSIKKGGIKSELSVYDFCLIPYNISIWAKKKGLSQKYGAAPIILNLQVNSNLLKFKYEQRRKR